MTPRTAQGMKQLALSMGANHGGPTSWFPICPNELTCNQSSLAQMSKPRPDTKYKNKKMKQSSGNREVLE